MFKIDERLPKESAKDYVVRQLVYCPHQSYTGTAA